MNEYDIPIVLTIEAHSCENAVKIAQIIADKLEENGETAQVVEKAHIDYKGPTI